MIDRKMTLMEAAGWYIGLAILVLFASAIVGVGFGIMVRMMFWVAGVTGDAK